MVEKSVGLPLQQKKSQPEEICRCQGENSDSGALGSHLGQENDIHFSLIPRAYLRVSNCMAVSGI